MPGDCSVSGIPWDEPIDGVLRFARTEVTEPDVPITTSTRELDWAIVRLEGGRHNGQLHTLPASCAQWQCGWCGEVYA